MIDVTKIVTAFTFAHSITLALASLDYIYIPSSVIEPVIALTVVIVALNNLFPLIHKRRWQLALAFGLIHGFGFAGVLKDLNLSDENLALSLLGFNLGVELGQLLIVAIFLPLIFYIREKWFYKRVVFNAGSWLVIGISLIWIIERVFNIDVIAM